MRTDAPDGGTEGGWVPGRGTFALRGVSVLDEIIGRTGPAGTEPERAIS